MWRLLLAALAVASSTAFVAAPTVRCCTGRRRKKSAVPCVHTRPAPALRDARARAVFCRVGGGAAGKGGERGMALAAVHAPFDQCSHARPALSPCVSSRQGLASIALARSTAERAPTVMMARRRNTKLEKRKRNEQNMRKFKKVQPKVGGRKAPSRKKLALKAASLKEKERESQFVAKLYQCVSRATPNRARERVRARAHRPVALATLLSRRAS